MDALSSHDGHWKQTMVPGTWSSTVGNERGGVAQVLFRIVGEPLIPCWGLEARLARGGGGGGWPL